jgi:HK97 gp10 family phage protein
MDVNVKITGVEEVINKIQTFNTIANSELGQKMVDVVDAVMGDAKNFAPVDTGYLRQHITGKVISKIRGVVIIGQIRSSARYSIFQERGWSGQPEGHPYLYPALLKNRALMMEKFSRAMDEAITKAAVGKYYGGGKKGLLTEGVL